MPAEDTKNLVRAMIERVWNAQDADAIPEYVAGELVDETVRHHRELADAFSDIDVAVEDLIAEGDRAAARLVVSGTHDKAPFAGAAPSGRRLTWASFRFYRVANGRVVETWAMQDRLGLLQQLGLVPDLESSVSWVDGAE